MKVKAFKGLFIFLVLALITFLSANILIGGSIVTIESKGKAWAESEGGTIRYGCDNSDNVTCTITIDTCPDN